MFGKVYQQTLHERYIYMADKPKKTFSKLLVIGQYKL